MIGLSGLEPERDIAIEIVGRRAGEKLHEELFNPYERPQPTPAEKILLAEREPLDPAWVEETFDEIGLLVLEGDAAALAAKVAELSPRRALPLPSGPRPRLRPLHAAVIFALSVTAARSRSTGLRRLRRDSGAGGALTALLRAGARGQAAARVGGPRARAARRRRACSRAARAIR